MFKEQNILTAGLLIVLLATGISGADELTDINSALRKIFPDAARYSQFTETLSPAMVQEVEEKAGVTFSEQNRAGIEGYAAVAKGEIIGFAFIDAVAGKWGTIHYVVGISPEGEVVEVVVLAYDEIRGRPVAKKRFLRQYADKSGDDPIELRRDIQGVTGATISSRSLTDGVRKLVHIFEIFSARHLLPSTK